MGEQSFLLSFIIIIFAAIRYLLGGQWFWKFKQFNSFILSIFSLSLVELENEITQIIKHRCWYAYVHENDDMLEWYNVHNVSAFLVGWLNGYIIQTCSWCVLGVCVCRLPCYFGNDSFFELQYDEKSMSVNKWVLCCNWTCMEMTTEIYFCSFFLLLEGWDFIKIFTISADYFDSSENRWKIMVWWATLLPLYELNKEDTIASSVSAHAIYDSISLHKRPKRWTNVQQM